MSISEPMHMSKPGSDGPRRIEVFTGTGRRRTWTVEEKAAFVAESHVAGETVCGVARRHGLTPQQLFTWRREARLRSGGLEGADPLFVP
jgi:transposase